MRRLICFLFLFATALVPLPTLAQDYPTKPVQLIVGFLPGAGGDFTSRLMADALRSRLGQAVIVENKPGAGSMIATDIVAKASPDGYTLLWGTADSITVLPAVKPNAPYVIPRDLSYISRVVQIPMAIAITSKLPINSMADFVAYAKANPGKLRYGTSGVGGGPHLAALLLEKIASIKLTHVPYKGSAASLTDLLGGFIDMAMLSSPAVVPYANSDKIKIIAVTSPKRVAALKDVPTLTESGFAGATVVTWGGMFGPPGLTPAVLDRLRKAVADSLNDPAVKQSYAAAHWDVDPLSGDAFRKSIEDELQQWKSLADSEHIVVND